MSPASFMTLAGRAAAPRGGVSRPSDALVPQNPRIYSRAALQQRRARPGDHRLDTRSTCEGAH